MKFVKFERGKQREFMRKVKERSGLTWTKLAKPMGKSRAMLFCYLREDCYMPEALVRRLRDKYHIGTQKFRLIYISNRLKSLQFPKLSEKFAEFLGALAGDGHLGQNPSALVITCHKVLDLEYVQHLAVFFKGFFGHEPTIYFRKNVNVVNLRFYSKELVSWFSKTFDLPVGKKKNRLHIPKQILKKREYLISYIRGLFDTDGCISRHHKKWKSGGMLEIISADKGHLKEIYRAFIRLGFTTSIGYKSVIIYRKDEIHKFFKVIKPANKKHLDRYSKFKEEGYL